MSTTELTSKVRKLKKLKAKAEALQAEIADIEDIIKAEMTARDTEEMQVDIFKVRWIMVRSNRIDTTVIKKELPDIASRYTKQTETRRFTVA